MKTHCLEKGLIFTRTNSSSTEMTATHRLTFSGNKPDLVQSYHSTQCGLEPASTASSTTGIKMACPAYSDHASGTWAHTSQGKHGPHNLQRTRPSAVVCDAPEQHGMWTALPEQLARCMAWRNAAIFTRKNPSSTKKIAAHPFMRQARCGASCHSTKCTHNLREQPHCQRHRNIMPEYTPIMLKKKETRVSRRQNGPHKSTCNLLMRAALVQAGLCLLHCLGRLGLGLARQKITSGKRSSERIHLWPHSRESTLGTAKCPIMCTFVTLPVTASSTVRTIQHQHNVQQTAVTTCVPGHCSSVTYHPMLDGQARDEWATSWSRLGGGRSAIAREMSRWCQMQSFAVIMMPITGIKA